MKKKITITYPYTNFDTVALLINTNKRYLLLEKVLNYRRKKHLWMKKYFYIFTFKRVLTFLTQAEL